jgi:hypothetical protein
VLLSVEKEVSIFIHLSGEMNDWFEIGNCLDSVLSRYPEMRVVLISTSESHELEVEVRNWIKSSSIKYIHYIRQSLGNVVGYNDNSLYGLDFIKTKLLCKVYNTMRRVVKSPFVLCLDSDVKPPDDVLEILSSSMTPETVSVSAVCPHRFQNDYINAWKEDGVLLSKESNCERVKGNGFGCVLLRMDTLRNHVFTLDAKCKNIFEAFYNRLSEHHVVKLDRRVVCENLSSVLTEEDSGQAYEFEITSSSFDSEFYLRKYPDVKIAIDEGLLISAHQHYVLHGKQEGKTALPLEPFDESFYLTLYQDVKNAVTNGVYECGLEHFVIYGQAEGRRSRKLEPLIKGSK